MFKMCLVFFYLSMQIHTYISAPYAFRNFKSKSSANLQTHYTKNNLSNFDNLIAMGDEE